MTRLIDADKINFKWINGVICVEQKEVENAPTVDAEQVKHGRWIKYPLSQNGFPSHIYMMRKCSECGHISNNVTPYCPWCGAKMDAERKDND